MKTFCEWWLEPARWWEFWMPQSGLGGGVVAGILIALVRVAVA